MNSPKLVELAREVVATLPYMRTGECLFCDSEYYKGISDEHGDDCAWFALKKEVEQIDNNHV